MICLPTVIGLYIYIYKSIYIYTLIYIYIYKSNRIQHSMMRKGLRREYFHRVKVVLRMSCMVETRYQTSMGLHYRFSLIVLASFIRGAQTCSSLIDRPESSCLSTVSTILLQTLTD